MSLVRGITIILFQIFIKNLLLFVILTDLIWSDLKIPTCRWFLILQLSPWGLHKWCSQARGGWSLVFFLLLFSISPLFSRSFQVSRLLPAYNLRWFSFWGTYLTTSDPEHKEHTYFSYLLCLRKFFKKNFHFILFLKFWTEVEEYLLKNTVFIFESSPHDQWSMFPPHCLCSYPGLVTITSPPVLTYSWRVSSDGDETGRKIDHDGSPVLLPGS